MRRGLSILAIVWVGLAYAPAAGQPAPGATQTYKGLQISVTSVERAPSAGLNDCPPGENRVNALSRPGEEFAVVTLAFKVLPAFQPGPIKRAVLTDTAGKTYNTAVSFIDVGKVPEFSCQMPFRVPAGTALKSLAIESATLDLTAIEKKKPN